MDYQFASFQPRKTTFISLLPHGDWRIKVYTINEKEEFDIAVLEKVLRELPTPALTQNRYGVGFLIIHQGVVANWFLLNWWGYEDIIHQKLLSSPVDDFGAIKSAEDKTIMACIHELAIHHFEVEAWKKWVLLRETPDFEEYLKTVL